MNCSKARKWLLLDDAGELPADRRARLAAHLAGCAECRNFAASLADLRGQYRAEGGAPNTPLPTLTAILTAARGLGPPPAPRRAPHVFWWSPPRALAAVAAAFLFFSALAVGLWRHRLAPSAARPSDAAIRAAVGLAIAAIENEWCALEGELAMARLEIGDWLSATEDPAAEGPAPVNEKGAGT